MLSEKMTNALNTQINAEMYSAYLYLSMEGYFKAKNLSGMAKWMECQAQEELSHAMRLYYHMQERGGRPVLDKIEAPEADWDSPLAVFEAVLAHEKKVSGLINDLVTLANEEKDYATSNFLIWFVNEQVEEEDSADGVLQQLKLAEGAQGAIFMIDKDLGTRVFINPFTAAAAQ